MPSSYALGPHFEALIRTLLESGRYANASEVVRAGLRLLEEHEAERERLRREFWTKVDEGLADDEARRVVPAEQVFAEIREMVGRKRRNQRAAAE